MQNVRGTKTLKVIIYYAIMETRTIYVDNKKLRYIECENEKWYMCADIYSILGHKKPGTSRLRASTCNKKLLKTNLCIRPCFFINTNGAKEFLLSRRKLPHKTLNEFFGVHITDTGITSKEAQIGTMINKSFKDKNIIPQYKVPCNDSFYFIDFYFPDENIAIEIDEFGHKDRNAHDEIKRQSYIEGKLQCKFLRCNPDDASFDIFDFIYELRMLLKQ